VARLGGNWRTNKPLNKKRRNMRKTEIIVGLDSLRYDLEQWKLNKRNSNYYDEVLAEALVILVDLDE
jgi:hypothetical protein